MVSARERMEAAFLIDPLDDLLVIVADLVDSLTDDSALASSSSSSLSLNKRRIKNE